MLDAFFEAPVVLYDGGDTYNRESLEFRDVESVLRHIEAERARGYVMVMFAAYDPAAGGVIHVRKTEVDPERFRGKRMRYTREGWGLIQLLLTFGEGSNVEVGISVNSRKRAESWAGTLDRMGSPDLWDWKLVEKHARRAIRVLRKAAAPKD